MTSYLTAGLIAFVTLLAGFYGGYRYEAGRVPTTTPAAATSGSAGAGGSGAGRIGGGGFGGAGGAGGFIGRGGGGTVTDLTSTGFTLHTAAGTDTKVTFGPSLTVRKTTAGSVSDLKDNETVTVGGQRDASGNLTATTITIVPIPAPTPAA